MNMPIVKTSIQIEEDTWKKWLKFTIEKKGSARKASELLAEAIEEYMNNHAN
jgi:hypothetical protein